MVSPFTQLVTQSVPTTQPSFFGSAASTRNPPGHTGKSFTIHDRIITYKYKQSKCIQLKIFSKNPFDIYFAPQSVVIAIRIRYNYILTVFRLTLVRAVSIFICLKKHFNFLYSMLYTLSIPGWTLNKLFHFISFRLYAGPTIHPTFHQTPIPPCHMESLIVAAGL